MKKVFLVYGHYNDKSFNSAIKDNFIKSAKENGHLVECVDLYKEKFDPVYAGENADDIVLDHRRKIDDSDLIVLVAPIWNYRMPARENGHVVECVDLYREKFDPVYAGENADDIVLDHRRKIDDSDLIVLVAPIWNYRMPAIVEGWIDKVLAPPWAFSFKKLFGNYGYAVGKLKSKKALIFCTYGSPRFSISDFFLNLPLRRIKKGIFNKCGIYDITYKRYFAVPFVSNEKRIEFLEDVKNTARHL